MNTNNSKNKDNNFQRRVVKKVIRLTWIMTQAKVMIRNKSIKKLLKWLIKKVRNGDVNILKKEILKRNYENEEEIEIKIDKK